MFLITPVRFRSAERSTNICPFAWISQFEANGTWNTTSAEVPGGTDGGWTAPGIGPSAGSDRQFGRAQCVVLNLELHGDGPGGRQRLGQRAATAEGRDNQQPRRDSQPLQPPHGDILAPSRNNGASKRA